MAAAHFVGAVLATHDQHGVVVPAIDRDDVGFLTLEPHEDGRARPSPMATPCSATTARVSAHGSGLAALAELTLAVLAEAVTGEDLDRERGSTPTAPGLGITERAT